MRHRENLLLPHMNSSLDTYLARTGMARNQVWGTEIEILSAASLLSTDIYVYTKFAINNNKWQKFSRTMLDGNIPENNCSIYINNSTGDHYDVVLDVCSAGQQQIPESHLLGKISHIQQKNKTNADTSKNVPCQQKQKCDTTIQNAKRKTITTVLLNGNKERSCSQNKSSSLNKKNVKQKVPSVQQTKVQTNSNRCCKKAKLLSECQSKTKFQTPNRSSVTERDAKKNIASFHKSLDYTIYQCTICSEAWPQKTKRKQQGKAVSVYVCSNCSRDKQTPKKFSKENSMIPSSVPMELQNLTQIEEMLIARALPLIRVYMKPGGQRGYSGHCINLPQSINELANSLPHYPKDIPIIVVSMKGKGNTFKDVTV